MKVRSKCLWRGLTAALATMLALTIVTTSIADAWRAEVDKALGTSSSKVVTDESVDEDLYTYKSDYTNTDALVAAHKDLGERIQEEGTVLLKNNGTLPLAFSTKVTLLGMHSLYAVHGGNMGSSVNEAQNVTLSDALAQSGFEVNPVTLSIYEQLGSIETGTITSFRGESVVYGYRPYFTSPSFTPSNETNLYSLGEPSVSLYADYDSTYLDSFQEYNDAAIIVVGRPSSEAFDYYPGKDGYTITEINGAAIDEGGKNVLSLTKNEKELIETAKENFDNVIVLVNCNNAMELEDLKQDAGVDAVLWIGSVGNYGMLGLADILNGTVSPSGHLPDTYAVNSTSSPAMANYGLISYANQDEVSTSDIGYATQRAGWYLVEAEGIYTGYKYYETRYADSVAGKGKASADGWNYNNEVSWSFGYGLSYTTFEQVITDLDVNLEQQAITAKVQVTNTGNVAGKDVVQLYVQTPYTQYDIDNKVEKSAVEFIGFEKTDILSPSTTEEITITVDMKYLASYDAYGAGTYILDAGEYYFALGNGAHDALNNILAKQGMSTSASVMDYDGNAELVRIWTLNEPDTTTFAVSENGTKITNQLADMDLNYYQPDTVTYLTRNDWAGTFPKTYDGIAANEDMITNLNNDTYEVKTIDAADEVTFGIDLNLSLADLKGAAYEDEGWELLLDQMSAAEIMNWIACGGTSTKEIISIGSPLVWQNDGPNGFSSYKLGEHADITNQGNPTYMEADDPNAEYSMNSLQTEPIMGAAFSKELINKFGKLIGNDSLWSGNTIIWAASLNLHRTPYNGRNHEYYSEDAMLINYLGAELIKGSKEYGSIVGVKHFAFNDQETNRVGISNYMNEQKAREGELRAFQGAFEDAGALGGMTSFTRFGCTYSNTHIGVMQNILREEWGFRGLLSTDMVNGENYFQPAETVIGGITMMANTNETYFETGGAWADFTYDNIKNDKILMQVLRDNAHYQLYALANSNAMNGLDSSSRIVAVKPWWEMTMMGLSIGLGAVTMLTFSMYIISVTKGRREED